MAHAAAQPFGHGGNGINANALRKIVIIDVTALRDALHHIHVTMAAPLPAMETPVAQL